MGDTPEEALREASDEEMRREKPLSLDGIAATKSLNPAENEQLDASATEQPETSTAAMRYHATVVTDDSATGSSVALMSEEHSSVVSLRRESQHYEDTSPSSSSLNKALFGRTLRNPSSVGLASGPTTRKCVLTLDGYSYVIVASTPENLPKREDSANITNSSNNSCAAINSSVASERYQQQQQQQQQLQQQQQQQQQRTPVGANSGNIVAIGGVGGACGGGGGGEHSKTNSPTAGGGGGAGFYDATATTGYSGGNLTNASLNGQVAKHGSLTIVRRSNSRKSFSQLETQQQLQNQQQQQQQQQQQTVLVSPLATSAAGADNWPNNLTFSIAATKATTSTPIAAATTTTSVSSDTSIDNRTKLDNNTSSSSSETNISYATTEQQLQESAQSQQELHQQQQQQQQQQKYQIYNTTVTASGTATASGTTNTAFSTKTVTIRKTLSRGESTLQQSVQSAELHMSTEKDCPPSSPNQTNFATHSIKQNTIINRNIVYPPANLDTTEKLHTTPASIAARSTRSKRPISKPSVDMDEQIAQSNAIVVTSSSAVSALSTGTSPSVSIEWSTENLPAVDTVDALDKAAARLRNLLHQLNTGDVSSDDLQKNLHYAARVLEAVFLDETSGGKTPSQQQQCNGCCKNPQCNQHSHMHTDDATSDKAHANTDAQAAQQNDNNNSTNSSCTLQQSGEEPALQQDEDNQTVSIDSRTKGVTSAPQTHSGPTGPPATEDAASTTTAATETCNDTTATTTAAETEPKASETNATANVTTTTTTTTSNLSKESIESSSSCSSKATMQRQRRLRTPVWARSMSTSLAASTASSMPPTTSNKTCHAKENHGQAIFGITFNHWLSPVGQPLIFATAGSNRCTVYECPRDGGLKVLMVYADPDPDEIFYTCAWTFDLQTSVPLLATAGYRGVIRVIDVVKNQTVGNYIGHGQAINELKYHYQKPHLLLSASKDHAIRLWNTQTHVCIAIFGGVEGHRDEVLSIDFDIRGERIMSCGMDHSLKLWCIDKPDFKEKIELSDTFNANKSQVPFPTIMQHFPDFSTRDIHRNYVDCVHWFENYILSKSCENSIVCWKPGQLQQQYFELKPNDSRSTIITEFAYNECEMWFIRFGFNPWQHILALGNQHGKVFVWELDPNEPKHTHACVLSNNRCNSIVRQIAFSRDASVLVYICDDGTVWRWNRSNSVQKK